MNDALSLHLNDDNVVLFDAEDRDLVAPYAWYAFRSHSGLWYARANDVFDTRRHPRRLFMHRVLLGAESHQQVDHRNGNGLDNQRQNLRLCTNAQNQQNRHRTHGCSQFKGVTWDKKVGRWRAVLQPRSGRRSLGYFDSEIEAARAYDVAARATWGEFARTNFPLEQRRSA